MLPLLSILLLVPAISAVNEFPNLMKDIQVVWGGVDLTSKLDARLTSSLDNQLAYFFLCGPFKTGQTSGQCQTKYSYETATNTVTGVSSTPAYFTASYDDNTFTCMRFNNPIPDFLENKKRKWYAKFTCDTLTPTYTREIMSALGAITITFFVGLMTFKFGVMRGGKVRTYVPRPGLNFAGNQSGSDNNPMYNAQNSGYRNPLAQNL